MKILIHPNQWIINYVGIRYWTFGRPIEDWKNEANHQRWKTVYTVGGRYEGWREKREWEGGGVARRGV